MNFYYHKTWKILICSYVLLLLPLVYLMAEDLKLAMDLHKQGTQLQGNRAFDDALAKYSQAGKIWGKLLSDLDEEGASEIDDRIALGVIKTYFNTGNVYYRLGEFEQAEVWFRKCIQIQEILEAKYGYRNFLRRGRAHRELAKLLTKTGGFDLAYEQLNLAKQYLTQAVPFFSQDMGTLENAYSLLFLEWSEPDSLLVHSNRKYSIYDHLGNQYFKSSALVSQAVAEELLNNLEVALQKIDSALAYYLQEPERHGLTIAKARNNKAHILAKMGRHDAAIALEEQILLFIDSVGMTKDAVQERIDVYNSKAYFSLLKGDFEKSLQDSDTAMAINAENFPWWNELGRDRSQIEGLSVYSRLDYLSSLGNKARALFLGKHTKEAKSAFTLAINYLNKIRREYNDTESKLKLTETAKVIFEGAIALHLDPAVNEPEKAFAYAEQSKAFTLLEGIKHSKAMRMAKVPEKLLGREYELRREIARLERKYLAADEPEEKTEYLQAIRPQKEELSALMTQLQKNKNYRKLMSFEAPSIRKLQKKALGEGQTLVEYFVGEEKTYVFVLPKKGKLRVLQVEVAGKELNQQVDQFWSSIFHYGCDREVLRREAPQLLAVEKEERQAVLKKRYLELGQALYTDLFEAIVNLNLGSRYVIVPDEGLSYLPFDALLQGIPEIDNFSFYPYLGRKYTLSYAYSGNLLLEMQGGALAKARKILAIAPSFSSRQLAINKSALSRLTNNETEVNAICEIFRDDCDPRAGEAADKKTFLELIEANAYRIIHLSTHGKANDKNPDQSWISFTQTSQHLNEAELLYTSDLYARSIKADLVVLSACETNKGRLRRGEGIMSFARGFSAAGVKSVLSTFWVIGEDPSLLIMKDFYAQLDAGAAKDEALQMARAGLMDNSDFSHPFYWSAFVPIGQMSEVKLGWSGNWLLLLSVGLLVILWLSKVNQERSYT